MSSISPVSSIPSTPKTTEIAPIFPVAGKTAGPKSFAGNDATGAASKPQAANPPGVGRLLDIKA